MTKFIDLLQFSSIDLAINVCLYMGIGFDKDVAKKSMKELARRRDIGEEFDYEEFINLNVNKFQKSQNIDYVNIIKGILK